MDRLRSSGIDIIGCDTAGTIPGLLVHRAARMPDAVAYSEYEDGEWRHLTWAEMAATVNRLRGALDRAGMERGDRVAILLPNCTAWVAFDIAAMANGLITVPLYLHDSPANTRFILSSSGARLCLVDGQDRLNGLSPGLAELPALQHVWLRKTDGAPAGIAAPAPVSLGEALAESDADPGPLRCEPRDIATVIHTSGTTGPPKGAMLSHHALLWNAEAVTQVEPPRTSDVFLSILPLAHAFERTMSYHLSMMGGARLVFARSVQCLRQDLLEVRPTILVAVPRLYERLHEAILKQVAASPVRRYLTRLTAAIGWRLFAARHGMAEPPAAVVRLLLWPLLERLVAGAVLRAFGGRVRFAISGGAPLSERSSRFLVGLGLPLAEGYGLTEAGPVVTATTLEDSRPGSVGRPLGGVEIRLGALDELLIRSPGLMQGYWRDPERSAAAIDGDGWLHTGDIAECRDGRLYITGRLKGLIVLSTGKKLPSAEVEAAIEADPLFEQCCAIGDTRPFVVAIVVLNGEQWAAFATRNGLEAGSPETPAASEALLARIATAMEDQPAFAQVRGVHAQLDPWTVEDGILTPTLKIKRQVIEERYGAVIDALYAQRASQRSADPRP